MLGSFPFLPAAVKSRPCTLWRVEKRRRPPTIIDVANAAGVGRSTASRVMRNHENVKPATRERVLRAAEELGYSPNPLAQGMLSGRTHTLGVVLGDVENPFFAQAMRAITDTAREAGYDVILANTDEKLDAERAAIKLMLDKRVDGILVSTASSLDLEHLQRAMASTPVVLIDRKAPAMSADTVVVDNFSAAFHATRLLTELGHRQIAVASNATRQAEDTPYISSVSERFDGVRAALRAAGLEADAAPFWIGGWSPTAHGDTSQRLSHGPRPTAILATDSLVALSALAAARRAGLDVPQDLSLITFDNSPWSEAFSPALTVVSQPVRELGTIATQMLIERAQGLTGPPREVQLQSTLIERESTAPPPE